MSDDGNLIGTALVQEITTTDVKDGYATHKMEDFEWAGVVFSSGNSAYMTGSGNRLTEVTHYSTYANYAAGASDKIVEYAYDSFNYLIGRIIDADGSAGAGGNAETVYAYDGDQIALQFDHSGSGDAAATDLSHRYLWNAQAVDQLFAEEQTHYDSQQAKIVSDAVLWALTDHENSIRDLAVYNSGTDATTVADHRIYDAYGNLTAETAAVDCVFGYTGRQTDAATGLQNNLNRWYDPSTGRWISQDPIGFSAGDANLYRYVNNSPLDSTDPSGLCSRGRDWLDHYANAFNNIFGSWYSDTTGRLVYNGLVGSGLMSNTTLANASANQCLAGTALASAVVGGGLFLGGEALLGVGTGSAIYSGFGYWIGGQWYASAAYATSPWTLGLIVAGCVYNATGNVDQSLEAGLLLPMMFPDRAANDLAQATNSVKQVLGGDSNGVGLNQLANGTSGPELSANNVSNRTGATFADDTKLADHFQRHGNDFGAATPTEYQSQANTFLTSPRSPSILEKVRSNGDIVRYNPTTDEFGVMSQNGTIRTYYKPDPAVHGKPTNLEYFNEQ